MFNVADPINAYAEANGIDIILVGTHGRGAVSRFLIGSVAERLVRSATRPVLTVRAQERDAKSQTTDRVEHESTVITGA